MTVAVSAVAVRRIAPVRAFPMPGRTALIFWACAVGYFAVGWYLGVVRGIVTNDAISRVDNASAVLWSRAPHLAALGFVWPPLPSFLDLPLLLFRGLWPGLTAYAVPGFTESAVVMAAAVVVIRWTCRDLGATPRMAAAITVLFAINPMIVYYGANGMTEAWLILLLTAGSRHLVRWIANGATQDLVLSGLFPAFGYLCRYEALAAGGGGCLCVALIVFARSDGSIRARVHRALATAGVPAFPVFVAFAGWSLVSWLIVGAPYAQFSSRYGNTALLRNAGGTSTMVQENPIEFLLARSLDLGPGFLVVAGFCWYACRRRRDPRMLGVIAILGGGLAFMDAVFLLQMTFPWLRFHILIIPMTALLGAAATVRPPGRGRERRCAGWLVAGTVLAAQALAIPAAWHAMNAPQLWAETVLSEGLAGSRPGSVFETVRSVAAGLDAARLPEGSVLTDVSSTFAVVGASTRPRQFVIPSDPDFQADLAHPGGHVRYLLFAPNAASDVVARYVAGLEDSPRLVALPVAEFGSRSDKSGVFQLWKVVQR